MCLAFLSIWTTFAIRDNLRSWIIHSGAGASHGGVLQVKLLYGEPLQAELLQSERLQSEMAFFIPPWQE